jgi:dihydrodipicolinate synthase/N-acetylneuraminate lyase
MVRLEGIYCALWTPTDTNGNILWEAFEKHLAFVLGTPVNGIMALGSTAEFVHLTLTQRKQILERVARECKTRDRGLIANVSDIQIRNVIDLARHAKQAGATCISVLPPWYFALEQRDLAEFFIEVASASEAPLALYNYPEVTGKKIELETIESVARRSNLVAVKQSGADFAYHQELLKLGQQLGFVVMSGADTRLEEILDLGCTGSVSGLANAIPEVLCEIFENFRKARKSPGQTAFVTELSRRINQVLFPFNVKAAIAARGIETGSTKMPVSSETMTTYEHVLANVQALYQSAGLR